MCIIVGRSVRGVSECAVSSATCPLQICRFLKLSSNTLSSSSPTFPSFLDRLLPCPVLAPLPVHQLSSPSRTPPSITKSSAPLLAAGGLLRHSSPSSQFAVALILPPAHPIIIVLVSSLPPHVR